MAIALSLSTLIVKAFSEPYGELRRGVNGLADDETKLKDLSIRRSKP
jgi:hypothetical protein